VLIIDDDAAVCYALGSLLEAEGHTVVTAQSGKDAVKLLQSRQFDVVLTDLVMPEMDGLQTMEALKDLDPDLEVIVLTGHAAIRVATEALKRGACDYLQKPVSLLELSAAVERAVELRRLKSGNCLEGVTGVPGTLGRQDLALSQLIRRQHAEEELRLTQFAVDHATDAVFWMDRQGRIVYANEAACRSLGRTREEVLVLSIPDIDPLLAQTGWESAWQLIKERRSMTLETQHRRKDGTAFPVEVSAKYLEFGGKEYSFTFVRDITERKRTELALQASERRYRRFLERSAAGVIRNTPDGTIVDCNQAALRILGYPSQEELQARRIGDLYCDSKDREIVLARLRKEKTLTAYEFRFLRKDGTTAWLLANLTLAEEDGQEIVEGTVIDISARERAEEELRHREAELRDALRAAQMGVWNWTLGTDTVTWDEALFRIAGRDPKLPAPSYTEQAEMFAPESLQRLKVAMENTLATGTPCELDVEMVLPDGSKKWAISRGEPRRDAGGRITWLRGTLQDITERVRSQEVKALLASIVESSDDAIIGKALDGTILSWNKGAEILYGYSAEEVIGRPIAFLAPADRSDEIPNILERIRRGEKISHFETARLRKDGTPVAVAVTVSPIISAGGEVTGAATIAHDISERKRAEEELRNREAELRDALRAAQMGVWNWTVETDAVTWDEALYRITGRDPNSPAPNSKEEAEVFTPESLERLNAAVEKTRATGSPYELGVEIVLPDGSKKWLIARGEPRRDAEGRITWLRGTLQDITERVRSQEVKALLASIVESSDDAIIGKALDGTILSWNKGAEILYGYSAQEVIGRPVAFLAPADRSDEIQNILERIRSGEKISHFETVRLRKDGNPIDVAVTVSPIISVSGEVTGAATIAHDISERKRAEAELMFKTALLEAESETTIDGILVVDEAGKIVSYNRQFALIFGVPEGLKGQNDRPVLEHVLPQFADSARFRERVDYLYEHREVKSRDEIVLVDGRTLDRYSAPLVDSRGVYRARVWYFRDITERKRAEERLRKLSRAVEQSPAAVVITDVQGAIEYVNPKFTQITGYSAAEVKGQNPRILKSGMQSPSIYEGLWTMILSGAEWRGELANRKKSGEIYWESSSIVPIRDSAGAITHFLAVKEDITERKRAEEELRRAKDAAEAANRAKSQFLANMSHEIRTPMNGVIGMAGLLLDTELSHEQRRYAEIVRSSGEALLAVINDILDFSRIEARKLNLECADFDLRSVLEYAASLVGIKTVEKKLELVFEVVPGTPCLLRGDAGRLRQVLVNLLGNAVKFTAQGEVAVRVRVDSEDEQKATLHFTVRDTGIGFRQDLASVLFEPFVQADGSKTRRYGGTGLGLTISKQLVELMGGRIGVRSQEGKGAAFWFTAVFEKQPAASAPSTGIQPGLRDARVLVVDDNATNRHMLCALLHSWGCWPEESADAASAVSVLRQAARISEPFQIAVLDMDLPDKNGVDLGRQIASDPELEATALYLMTGFGRFVAGARLQAMGFAGQVAKPIWELKLLETLLATCSPGRASEAPRGGISKTARGRAGAKPRFRILVAEDNPTNQEVAGMMLRKLGFSADLVANGLEALKALQQRTYDLLLLDCEMPEMDGYETARRIRDPRTGVRDPAIPIVALTADAISGDRERCLQTGMNDYLAKPVEPNRLEEVLGRWLAAPGAQAGGRPGPVTPRKHDVFRPDALLDRFAGDTELARKILAGFLGALPQQVKDLCLSVMKGDARSTCLQAHALKGAAATVAAESLRAACCELQDTAEAGNFSLASALLPKLEEEVNLLTATVRRSGLA
jgi:PAS domain S-box-containing protein